MENETRKERLSRLNAERLKRFKERHNIGYFKVDIPKDRLDKIKKRLEVDGMTQLEFILRAFDYYKRNGGFPDYTAEYEQEYEPLVREKPLESEKVVELMRDDPKITIDKISKKLGKSPATIQRHINKLRDEGKIERIGQKGEKSAFWKIND